MGKRNYRRKQEVEESDEEESEEQVNDRLEERKELQKFRQKQRGVSAAELAVGTKLAPEEQIEKDPFKLKTGGLVDLKGISTSDAEAVPKNLGTAFSTETNQLDEDVQMLKYIDEQIKKKRGEGEGESSKTKNLTKEDLLYQLPANINVKSKIMRSEEMLSHQMLSGIPEVDLGIEAKIKNIESTEVAKQKMIDDSRNRKQQASVFVPTNMASNFMHHSRFLDEKKVLKKEQEKEKEKRLEEANEEVDRGPTVGGEIVENAADTKFIKKALGAERKREKQEKGSSDDFMFERFKKKAREGSWR